jgi:hypothetical protein
MTVLPSLRRHIFNAKSAASCETHAKNFTAEHAGPLPRNALR